MKNVLKQYSAAPEPPGNGTRLDTIVTYDWAHSISNIFKSGILKDIAMQYGTRNNAVICIAVRIYTFTSRGLFLIRHLLLSLKEVSISERETIFSSTFSVYAVFREI